MKLQEWERILVLWANALQLNQPEVSTVKELFDGEFFVKLFQYLGFEGALEKNSPVQDLIRAFFKSEFSKFPELSDTWNSEDAIVITSMLLLCGSLRCHELRSPLYSLNGATQILIHAFIQKFIAVPCDEIDRDLVLDSLKEVQSEDDESPNEDDIISIGSPRLPRPHKVDSPDARNVNHAKVKSLECKLELLDWDKQHLQEEVDSLKEELQQTKSKCALKESQVLKLQNELFLVKNGVSAEPHDEMPLSPASELRHLKHHVESLSQEVNSLRVELDAEQADNISLKRKIRQLEEDKVDAELKCSEYEMKVDALQATVHDLESMVETLKATCKEQADLLAETSFVGHNAKGTDESIVLEETPGAETLANIVEIKYSEVEEELKIVRQSLSDSQQMILQLNKDLVTKDKELSQLRNGYCQRGFEEKEELLSLRQSLSERREELEDVYADNSFLLSSLEDKRKEVGRLQLELDNEKKENEHLTQIIANLRSRFENRLDDSLKDDAGAACDMTQMQKELQHLNDLVDGKQFCLEESQTLIEKLKKDITEKEAKCQGLYEENESVKAKYSRVQDRLSSLKKVILEKACKSLSASTFSSPEGAIDAFASAIESTSALVDELTLTNTRLEQTIKSKNEEIEIVRGFQAKAKDESNLLRQRLKGTEMDIDNLRGDLRLRATTVIALEQAVSMCEHEKAILQRRIDLLSLEKDKMEGIKSEAANLKSKCSQLEVDAATYQMELKRLKNQIEIDEKLNKVFDMKLSELQNQMKAQYDKDLSKALHEYSEKLTQMKQKMMKDKSHIEELSAELWETSDRYLLASQGSEALRNELRRTRAALELLTSSRPIEESRPSLQPPHPFPLRSNNPCVWLDDENMQGLFDERVTLTRERWTRRASGGGEARWSSDLNPQLTNSTSENNNELFGEAFLEDLKAGICRLPNEFLDTRASCPPMTKGVTLDSSGEKTTCERQSLLPPEKPKRKGQIAYSKPGPPTPSRNARLSLQNLDQGYRRTAPLRESVGVVQQSNRMSRIFGSFSGLSKAKTCPPPPQPPPSPKKAKRRSFFQRKFGNRENIPPT